MYTRDIDITFYRNTSKLRLVRPDPTFASTTIRWIGQQDVTKYLGADFSGMTVEDEVNHLNTMLTDPNCFSWMIELDGEIVGNVEINEINELTDKYGVKAGAFCTLIGDKSNWGKGLGSCSKQAACNWAFKEGAFELIEAKAYVRNYRSWSALEKLGYKYHGVEDGEVEGQPVQWKVYTLDKAQWQKLDWPT